MEEKILALYACGMSQRDIAEQIKELYLKFLLERLPFGVPFQDCLPWSPAVQNLCK